MLANLNNDEVVFIDSRTPEEYAGTELRGNARGGHLPGAKLLPDEEFLAEDRSTIDYEAAKAKFEAVIPKDKTVVIYCQTGTRCTHKELMLKDLGYENVVLYDASWQEWGNLQDTPIEDETAAPADDAGEPAAPANSPK